MNRIGNKINAIYSYYEHYDEDSRLNELRSKKTEFLTTNFILERYLEPGSRLLDLGTGTGAYSIYYASKGFNVYARDIVPYNIKILSAKPECSELGINAGVADGRDLSEFPDETFDVVLCLGPMYHLGCLEDRRKCLSECLRVLKTNGILAIAYILKFSVFAIMVQRDRQYLSDEYYRQIIDNRTTSPDDHSGIWFFDTPQGIESLMSEFPVTRLTNAGTDGISILMGDTVNSFNDSEYKQWLNYHFNTCEEPSILGYSNHAIYVCKKQ